jgi:hypothetical protein
MLSSSPSGNISLISDSSTAPASDFAPPAGAAMTPCAGASPTR